jgi:hypothetical protein
MSQSCVPATPAFGQSTMQLAPGGQTVWHGPLAHAKWQSLPWAQVHVPLAQVPSHTGLFPSHVTWHGGAPHSKVQLAPDAQVQSPFEHVPRQLEPAEQST